MTADDPNARGHPPRRPTASEGTARSHEAILIDYLNQTPLGQLETSLEVVDHAINHCLALTREEFHSDALDDAASEYEITNKDASWVRYAAVAMMVRTIATFYGLPNNTQNKECTVSALPRLLVI